MKVTGVSQRAQWARHIFIRQNALTRGVTESGVEREGGLEDALKAFPGSDPRIGRAFMGQQEAEGEVSGGKMHTPPCTT